MSWARARAMIESRATIAHRAARLRAMLEREHGPGQLLFAAVICNGCGLRHAARSPEELAKLTYGWRIGEFGGDDYCPSCQTQT